MAKPHLVTPCGINTVQYGKVSSDVCCQSALTPNKALSLARWICHELNRFSTKIYNQSSVLPRNAFSRNIAPPHHNTQWSPSIAWCLFSLAQPRTCKVSSSLPPERTRTLLFFCFVRDYARITAHANQIRGNQYLFETDPSQLSLRESNFTSATSLPSKRRRTFSSLHVIVLEFKLSRHRNLPNFSKHTSFKRPKIN